MLISHTHIVSNVYKWHSASFTVSLHGTKRTPMRLWDCGLCFEVLLYSIHLPILLPTIRCLAAAIAGGWHFLPARSWCWKDLWTKKRPVGVRDRCRGLTVLRTESNLEWFTVCLHHLCRGENYVGSGMSPWWLVCVSCSTHWGETRGDERLALSSNVNWVSHHFQHGSSGQLRVKWQLLSCVL